MWIIGLFPCLLSIYRHAGKAESAKGRDKANWRNGLLPAINKYLIDAEHVILLFLLFLLRDPARQRRTDHKAVPAAIPPCNTSLDP